MSASFAKSQAFHIDVSEEHCIPLEFADGTTAISTGIVRDMPWTFVGIQIEYSTNVCVLPDLPADIVLSYGFLCSTNAFVTHESSFSYDEDQGQSDTWTLSVIRIASRLIKGSKSVFPGRYTMVADLSLNLTSQANVNLQRLRPSHLTQKKYGATGSPQNWRCIAMAKIMRKVCSMTRNRPTLHSARVDGEVS